MLVTPARTLRTCVSALALCLAAGGLQAQESSVRVAYGDIASPETLNLLIALEGLKEKGVEVEFIELDGDDIVNQAVANDQADIGIGAPYAIAQRSSVPIRIFCQMSTLRFFPVVSTEYPDWASLDGQSFAVQGRGTGSEAMAMMIEATEGIDFSEISYVTGSEVRALSLVRGNLDAAFVDLIGRNMAIEQAGDKLHELPMPDVDASDETLFARADWLAENGETVDMLVAEIDRVWTAINEDPTFASTERERLGLLPDLPDDLVAEIDPYFSQAVESDMFPDDCGGQAAAASDMQFFTVAGQLEGDPASLNPEDFWDFGPSERVAAAGGETAPEAATGSTPAPDAAAPAETPAAGAPPAEAAPADPAAPQGAN